MSNFYIYTLVIYLFIFPMEYFIFRDNIHEVLRKNKNIRKRDIYKLKKGMKNFWWYESLHHKYDIGILYHLNKLITVFYPLTFVIFLIIGWINELRIFTAILYISVYIVFAVTTFINITEYNKRSYGKPFILLGYWGFKKNGFRTYFTIDSSLVQPINYLIFPAAMAFGMLYVIFN